MLQLKTFALITGSSILMLFACMGSSGKSGTPASSGAALEGSSTGDMYYEYGIVSQGKNMNLNGSMKMYLSAKGKIRVEMNMGDPASSKFHSINELIGTVERPNESISIDKENKTYSVNHINSDSLGMGQNEKMESTVTKAGEETILGFHCVHVRIISSRNIGNFYKSNDTIDLWKSKDVPIQESFKKLMDRFESRTGNYMYDPKTSAKLKEMGCEGFLVKFQMRTMESLMTEELKKVEHRDLAASLFEVPAGYKETPGL